MSAGETSVVKHVLKDRRTVSAEANNLKKPPPLTEEINDRQDPISDGFFVTGQSFFKESERSGEGNERTVRPVAAEPFEPDVSKPAESSSSPEKQPKEYFSKTAEIIEKGETSTAEIQNIIFQEVQEWAAATPDDSEMPLGNDPGHPEIVITKHFEQSKSPGVIYIRENSSRENERLAEPLEQSFDLSIGTISVVIEEAETSAHLAAPPQTNNRPPSTDAKREFSRLSRSYI